MATPENPRRPPGGRLDLIRVESARQLRSDGRLCGGFGRSADIRVSDRRFFPPSPVPWGSCMQKRSRHRFRYLDGSPHIRRIVAMRTPKHGMSLSDAAMRPMGSQIPPAEIAERTRTMQIYERLAMHPGSSAHTACQQPSLGLPLVSGTGSPSRPCRDRPEPARQAALSAHWHPGGGPGPGWAHSTKAPGEKAQLGSHVTEKVKRYFWRIGTPLFATASICRSVRHEPTAAASCSLGDMELGCFPSVCYLNTALCEAHLRRFGRRQCCGSSGHLPQPTVSVSSSRPPEDIRVSDWGLAASRLTGRDINSKIKTRRVYAESDSSRS